MRRFLLLAAILPIAGSAWGFDCQMGRRERVEAVSVGDRLDILLADGRLVAFPDIEPPRASPAEPDRVRATAAQLLALLKGKSLLMQPLGLADRWGRVPARLFLPDQAEPVDELLLGAGLVLRAAAPAPCDAAAGAAEDAARAAGAGLWSDPAFAVLSAERPQDFAAREGELALVEGRVASVGRTFARIYLNFSKWGGFFATVARRKWPTFERAGFSEAALRSRKLRLRGIVELGKGPHMELFHPGQIEFMDEPPPKAAKSPDPKL
jgi:endonuclease YncB( thermonuclease family)